MNSVSAPFLCNLVAECPRLRTVSVDTKCACSREELESIAVAGRLDIDAEEDVPTSPVLVRIIPK